jgi:hypothetical protein
MQKVEGSSPFIRSQKAPLDGAFVASGRALRSANLTEDEGAELLALVQERFEGRMSARKERRYQRLVGVLAGDPDLFETARINSAAAAHPNLGERLPAEPGHAEDPRQQAPRFRRCS